MNWDEIALPANLEKAKGEFLTRFVITFYPVENLQTINNRTNINLVTKNKPTFTINDNSYNHNILRSFAHCIYI